MELYWPIPCHTDGRRPQVSDGWHSQKDFDLKLATRTHFGVDVMYRRSTKGRANLPDQSPWYEVPAGTPVLSPMAGTVVYVGGPPAISRGGYIMVDHGGGIASQYMHLESTSISVGMEVRAGQQIGTVGFDPSGGYALRHLHFQMRRDYKNLKATGYRVNPAPYLRKWKVLALPL